MSKSLVLAEKPSVAKDIARILSCKSNGPSSFEGTKYIVTWGYGHLVTLATPDRYSKNYEVWKMEDLPILPNPFLLDIIPKTAKHYHQVIQLMRRQDVQDIIIATDAGREGELVARWILDKAKISKPLRRLWISSVTDKAIQEGFTKLKKGSEYDALYEAAKARAYADWVVGLNATRALTCHYGASLSCGRVQTPTLELIHEREESIRNFKGVEYWQIHCKIQGMTFQYRNGQTKESRIFSLEEAKKVMEVAQNQKAKILQVERSDKISYPPELYDLTTLQRDANRLYGYSAKETLNLMQGLYEHHKLLTYPRTDSKYIGKDVAATLQERLKAIQIGNYKSFVSEILRKPIKQSSSFVNDQKVSDHHAIIPTEQFVKLQDLSPKEIKIYDLVVKRFLSVLMDPYRYEQIKVKVQIGQYEFVTTSLVEKALGFKALYQGNANFEDELKMASPAMNSPFHLGDLLPAQELQLEKLMTKPKALLTEGELLG
ncbi:MAG: DNA topoisomerase III, partial [Vallitaleaceae bacterium]|nr:DNA topoisomerase III [Vallitaleaceae bacterium]